MKRWKALARFACALISAYALGNIGPQALKGDPTLIAVLAVIGFVALLCLVIWLALPEGN